MGVGKILSGSQLLQQTQYNELSTSASERSNVNFKNSEEETTTSIIQSNDIKFRDKKQVEGMVEALNEFLEPTHTSIKFELHDKLDKYYVTVVDSDTDELIKEIPPKKLLDVYAAMAEFMGFIVDEKI
ncbi:flagellar protein FlaG [Paraliobacillus ryukyuensis]|uniref:flagellar protein FlaG n=1 Tax=Paraliobacillus ryukyuensis TaxID=200904 RepID=UPI0009A6C0D6|nr:flagellar protein FlaG [Paraliobacillus ryukyuensis]